MNDVTPSNEVLAGVDISSSPDQMEQALVGSMKSSFGELGKTMIGSKIAEQDILRQSAADGGPASVQHAILNLMEVLNVGVRALAQEVRVKRGKLQKMLNGEIAMPPEVLSSICDSFERRKPSLFKFNEPFTKPKSIM